jgi:hypothetical protein
MQKKIRLEMENLQVETFVTVDDGMKTRGTVKGHLFTDVRLSDCCPVSASGTWPCLCASDPRYGTCDTTCNPDQCDCQSYPCLSRDCR